MPEERETTITPETERIIGEIVTDALQKIIPLVMGGQAGAYHCTGERYRCSTDYSCGKRNHSCTGTFTCPKGAVEITS